MSEENQNEQKKAVPEATAPVAESTQTAGQPVEQATEQEASLASEPTTEGYVAPAAEEYAAPAAEESVTQPQVIIQKERGFAHYVGFALLCVLCICFFFLPGIAITYAVSCAVDLTAAAAWIFSSILSVIVWLVFKMKISGFKKSFYWYIGLCVVIFLILITIQVAADYNIFSGILALLTGAKA